MQPELFINFTLENLNKDTNVLLRIGIIIILGLSLIISVIYLQNKMQLLVEQKVSPKLKDIYQQVMKPEINILKLILFLSIADIAVLINAQLYWVKLGELILSLIIGCLTIWLASIWFQRLFDSYLLDVFLQSQRKINTEFLIVGKYISNIVFIFIVIFVGAEVHKVNLFGLLASLGIGGLAVAFAAQKTLEQLLGGIVLYLDRPFVQDDYIGLPDRTFGRVESIGLRSTKIRTSGKGTLMIIPNNLLTQMNIENFTGAKKIISLIYLTFYCYLPHEERALIRQIILDSTKDIVGIDSRRTEVLFEDLSKEGDTNITKAQITFFILGGGDISMELRRQLLDIAHQNISQKLKEYGISFKLEEQTVDVSSPITV